MTYICFAASPIHLICFREYIYKYKIKTYKIYLISSVDPQVNKQLFLTLKFLKLKSFTTIRRHNFKLIQFLQKYILLFNVYSIHKNDDCTFIISDFRNTILHQLRIIFKKSKFILIDDGSQIFEFYEEYLEKNIYFPLKDISTIFGKLKSLVNYGNNINFLINTKFELFTIYAKELGLKNYSHNKLKFLDDNFDINSQFCESSVYFIGGKMAEENYLSYNEEIESLKKVKNFWRNKNKTLVYIAKRTTSKKKIELIKKELKIKVIFSDMPMELQFLSQNSFKIPKILCSLGSSVDKTFPMIYKGSTNYLMIINDLKKYDFFLNYFKLYKDLMCKSKLEKNIVEL